MVNLAEMARIIRSAEKVLEHIELAEAQATRTTALPTGMPHAKGKKSLVEEGAVTIADLKEVYNDTLTALETMREELSEMIETLPNFDERIIMKLKYIKGYTFEAISESIHMSHRNMFYHLKHAKTELSERYPDRFCTGEQRERRP